MTYFRSWKIIMAHIQKNPSIYTLIVETFETILTKIRPTVLFKKVPLAMLRGLTGGVDTHGFDVSKIFLLKF